MVNWSELQIEVGEWAEENFGGQPKINTFLGTAEERSELVERLFTGEIEPGSSGEKDAIGDIIALFADFCYRYDLSLEEAAGKRQSIELYTDCQTVEDLCVETVISRGNQAYSLLKQDQGVRLDRDGVGPKADIESLAHTLRALEVFANSRGYTLDEAIEQGWGEAKEREWDSNYN